MDTVAMHFAQASAVPALARCVESLATTLVVDSTTLRRPQVAQRLSAVADSLYRAGIPHVAYRAGRVAWRTDTATWPALLAMPWFVERSRRLAIGRTFDPGAVVLAGDSAVFSLRRTSPEPLELDSPGLATNWSITISARVDSTLFRVFLSHAMIPTDTGRRGGVQDLIASLTSARVSTFPSATVFPPPAVAPTSDGLRIVVRGAFVSALRAARPDSMTFVANPCAAVSEGSVAHRASLSSTADALAPFVPPAKAGSMAPCFARS